MPYRDDKYIYTISEIRSIEEMYLEGRYGEEAVIHYSDRKGREYLVSNPFSVAEYRADFERGCKFIGRTAGKGRMSYKEVERIVDYLNETISVKTARRMVEVAQRKLR